MDLKTATLCVLAVGDVSGDQPTVGTVVWGGCGSADRERDGELGLRAWHDRPAFC